jgi:hypothetical protein
MKGHNEPCHSHFSSDTPVVDSVINAAQFFVGQHFLVAIAIFSSRNAIKYDKCNQHMLQATLNTIPLFVMTIFLHQGDYDNKQLMNSGKM